MGDYCRLSANWESGIEIEVSKQRPNILWISLEDTSPRFGCMGDEVASTPNIDRLAEEGARFPNTFCTSPVCSPSRTAVITGRHATYMGAQHMRTSAYVNDYADIPSKSRQPYRTVPPSQVKCFTEILRAEGYFCTNNGKTDYQFAAPICAWDINKNKKTLESSHWRHRSDAAQPFFSVFNLERTHESGMWPKQDRALETNPDDVVVPPFLPDTLEVRGSIARQYDNIAYNDQLVGQLLQELEDDGLVDDTVVFLWSDHGEGLPRAKRYLYDSGLRVPMIVRWPGCVEAGQVDDRLVSLVDLPATVLSLLQIPSPVDFAGMPFIGTSQQSRNACFAHADRFGVGYSKCRSVRTQDFHYVRHYDDGAECFGYSNYGAKHEALQAIRKQQILGQRNSSADDRWPVEELYSVEGDVYQMDNLASNPDCLEILKKMRAELDQWQQKNDPFLNVPESEIAERFWPGGIQPITETPLAILYTLEDLEGKIIEQDQKVSGPVLLQFHCLTEGATISYRMEKEEAWNIYRHGLRLEEGVHHVQVFAERYGYSSSQTVDIKLSVSGSKTVS